jgi:hypothetical protein
MGLIVPPIIKPLSTYFWDTPGQLDMIIDAANEHTRIINNYDQPQAIYPTLEAV